MPSLPAAFWVHGFGDRGDQCGDPRPCELGTSPSSSPGWLGEQEGCSQLRVGKLRHGAVTGGEGINDRGETQQGSCPGAN